MHNKNKDSKDTYLGSLKLYKIYSVMERDFFIQTINSIEVTEIWNYIMSFVNSALFHYSLQWKIHQVSVNTDISGEM
jgi:hypothetical protein